MAVLQGLKDIALRAIDWVKDKSIAAWDWLEAKAIGAWHWVKKHPYWTAAIVLTVLAGVAVTVFCPPIIAALPGLPVLGPPLLNFCMAVAVGLGPQFVPFVLGGLASAAVAITSGFIGLVVAGFKKCFGGGPAGGSRYNDTFNGLEDDLDEMIDGQKRVGVNKQVQSQVDSSKLPGAENDPHFVTKKRSASGLPQFQQKRPDEDVPVSFEVPKLASQDNSPSLVAVETTSGIIKSGSRDHFYKSVSAHSLTSQHVAANITQSDVSVEQSHEADDTHDRDSVHSYSV